MTNLPWFWAITDQQQGPDFAFCATVAPTEAAPLAALVEQHVSPHFLRHTASADHIEYWDAAAHAKFCAQQQGADSPIWFGATIDLRGPTLRIHHYLGGQDYQDTPLIAALAQAPHLTLRHWRVSYGGDGYAGGDVAQGTDGQSLAAYLQGHWPRPTR